jgi:hypothetical protein
MRKINLDFFLLKTGVYCIPMQEDKVLKFMDLFSFGFLKGIDRPFRGRVESILIRSLLVNWRLGYFLNLILKGLLHKISKKPLDAA